LEFTDGIFLALPRSLEVEKHLKKLGTYLLAHDAMLILSIKMNGLV
jgi:hypothetical protein